MHIATQYISFSSLANSRAKQPLFVIVCIVVTMHLLLLGLGTYWNPAPPAPKQRAKVLVQTVALKPFQSETLSKPSFTPAATPASLPIPASAPIEQPKIEPIAAPSQPVKEEVPPPLPEPTVLKEEVLPIEESPMKKEEILIASNQEETPPPAPAITASPPLPIKAEISPKPPLPTPKPALQEKPKATPKPAAPVKKPIESAKKNPKNDAARSKEAEDASKKKNQELAEKKRQQELAEKKQQEKAEAERKRQQELAEKKQQQEKEAERKRQEKAEAERKRQQEIAEAAKKRQQEIAAAQEAAKQKELALLAKAQENLAKMSETRDKISTSSSASLKSTSLPKELGSLQVDAMPIGDAGNASDWGTKEASYSDDIAYRLKMALRLPDYGTVKIKLTLDRTGKVLKVEIVQSESNKNKGYVENKIPTLLFPSFGQRFQGVAQNTFVISLQNDS